MRQHPEPNESEVIVNPEGDDSQIEWSPDTPGAIDSRLTEIRSTISSLDSTSPADMSEFFFMHGFNELDLAVRDLLTIVEKLREHRPAGQTSPVSAIGAENTRSEPQTTKRSLNAGPR